MFIEVEKRAVADGFKRLIDGGSPIGRQRALDAVVEFERMSWQPQALDEAVRGVEPGRFSFDEEGRLQFDENGVDVRLAIMEVIDRYGQLIWPVEGELFTTQEALRYLNRTHPERSYTTRSITHAYYETKLLPGVLKGNMLFFTRAALDEFAVRARKRGRPHKQPVIE